MRAVILFVNISLDGFLAGHAGELDWMLPDPVMNQAVTDTLRERVDSMLLGRNAYLGFERTFRAQASDPASPPSSSTSPNGCSVRRRWSSRTRCTGSARYPSWRPPTFRTPSRSSRHSPARTWWSSAASTLPGSSSSTGGRRVLAQGLPGRARPRPAAVPRRHRTHAPDPGRQPVMGVGHRHCPLPVRQPGTFPRHPVTARISREGTRTARPAGQRPSEVPRSPVPRAAPIARHSATRPAYRRRAAARPPACRPGHRCPARGSGR